MSLQVEVILNCPNCSGKIPFTIWQSINVSLDPELKQRILDGSLFSAVCPSCENTYYFPFSFLYHDMDKQLMLFFRDENDEGINSNVETIPDEILKLGKFGGYRLRVINKINRLKEKIFIFDEDLDDIEIEQIKFGLIQSWGLQELSDLIQLYFLRKSKKAYHFYVVDENGNGSEKSISIMDCHSAKNQIFMKFDTVEEGVGVVNINYQWIEDHLEPLPTNEVHNKLLQEYDRIGFRPCCGRIEVCRDNLSGFVDINGNEVIPLVYRNVLPFVRGMSIVNLSKHKYGLIDVDGNEIIPCIYDNVTVFENGYARIEKGNYWAVIDENLKIIIPFNREFQQIESFNNGLALAKIGTKWGVIDQHGNTIVPFKYYEIDPFRNGLARIRLKPRLYGYINSEGEELIPPIYEYLGEFEKGVAIVWVNNKKGLIDKSANIIAEPIFDEISSFFIEDNAIVRINEEFGLINRSGNIILPVQFTDIDNLMKSYSALKEIGSIKSRYSMN